MSDIKIRRAEKPVRMLGFAHKPSDAADTGPHTVHAFVTTTPSAKLPYGWVKVKSMNVVAYVPEPKIERWKHMFVKSALLRCVVVKKERGWCVTVIEEILEQK